MVSYTAKFRAPVWVFGDEACCQALGTKTQTFHMSLRICGKLWYLSLGG